MLGRTMAPARAILPDAVTDDAFVLFKTGHGTLRLTNEIRLAVYLAAKSGKRVLLIVAERLEFAPLLQAFVAKHDVDVQTRDM
jgi:hypothetical protein